MIKYIFSCMFIMAAAYGQKAYGQQNRDSLIIKFAGVLKQRLNLSDSEVTKLIVIGRIEVAREDSINLSSLTDQEKNMAISKVLHMYNQGMKSIFTPDQWQLYQGFLDERKNNFKQKMTTWRSNRTDSTKREKGTADSTHIH